MRITALENRSTGFSWSLDNNCFDRLHVVDDKYEAHPGQTGDTEWPLKFGSAGKRTWVLSTPDGSSDYVKGVPCDMDFEYKQPWIPAGVDDTKKLVVTIN